MNAGMLQTPLDIVMQQSPVVQGHSTVQSSHVFETSCVVPVTKTNGSVTFCHVWKDCTASNRHGTQQPQLGNISELLSVVSYRVVRP